MSSSLPLTARPLGVTLRNAPILIGGDWGPSLENASLRVVEKMRLACVGQLELKSDRQPQRIHVENVRTGPPHIWLHFDKQSVADIVVDIGDRDWCKLAYQFGHELGHVIANSWGPGAAPRPGSQWLEESLVESFSLWGLGRLAQAWRTDPPFAGDNGFGDAIADYRQRQFSIYQGFAAQGPDAAGAKAWFKDKKADLETANGLTPTGLALAPLLVETMTHAPEWLEAIGALNRWPERSSLPLPSYLEAWIRSCGEIKANPALPERLQGLLL